MKFSWNLKHIYFLQSTELEIHTNAKQEQVFSTRETHERNNGYMKRSHIQICICVLSTSSIKRSLKQIQKTLPTCETVENNSNDRYLYRWLNNGQNSRSQADFFIL